MRTDTNFSGNPARVAAAVDGWVLPANTAYFVTVTTLSVDIRCDVLPPYLRYRRVFANLSEVPPVALFR